MLPQTISVSANVRNSTILIQKMIENTHQTTKQTTTSTIDNQSINQFIKIHTSNVHASVQIA